MDHVHSVVLNVANVMYHMDHVRPIIVHAIMHVHFRYPNELDSNHYNVNQDLGHFATVLITMLHLFGIYDYQHQSSQWFTNERDEMEEREVTIVHNASQRNPSRWTSPSVFFIHSWIETVPNMAKSRKVRRMACC
jgi:hypothetical protein